MSWRTVLRTLFPSPVEPIEPSRHIGVLVSGTLWHAESAVLQVGMQGLADGMTGAASVFGMPEGLKAQTSEGEWRLLSALSGRWLLVIPEDAYAHFRQQFDAAIGGTPIDGRVHAAHSMRQINQDAEQRVRALVAAMPPLHASS